jgi:cell wall-associated NlpC family hydrolase
MTLQGFIIKALGVKFRPKGRDHFGWDCYGLVCCAYNDVLDVLLPSFVDDYVDPGDTEASRRVINDLVLMEKQHWQKVSKPKAMDVVVFTLGTSQTHIGLMVDDKCFLHCERKVNTIIERLMCAKWKKRVEGIYRYQNV